MPTYNGLHHLKRCLPTLFNSTYKDFELILVDNKSSDDTIRYIENYYPQIILIKNTQNDGFAQGNNVGWKKAKGKYILFLSNDTKVEKDFLSELVAFLEKNPGFGGVQSKVFLMDDPGKLDSVGSFMTNTGFLYHYGVNKKDAPQYSKEINIYSAKGVCMLFRRKVIENVLVDGEIFDSTYFAYFEETDLCHRVWLSGSRIGYAVKSVIYHEVGGTSKKMNNAFIQFHGFKNRINSYLKNLSPVSLIRILPVHILLNEVYAFIALLQLNAPLFFSIQKAIFWNIVHLPQTLRKRNYIQKKIRKVSDSELMPTIMKRVKLSYYAQLPKGLHDYKDEPILA